VTANDGLERTYRAYLNALNERRFNDLAQFVHDQVTRNGEVMTCSQYAQFIAGDVEAIPDLHYVIDQLVVGESSIAARLWFDCTPIRSLAGLPTAGHHLQFAEHVFYRFRDTRITQVWSLIDTDAIRAQLP
jgi:predicted ester cyclase